MAEEPDVDVSFRDRAPGKLATITPIFSFEGDVTLMSTVTLQSNSLFCLCGLAWLIIPRLLTFL